MEQSKNYIAAAKEKAAREQDDLDQEVALARTQGFFEREKITFGSFFEGLALSSIFGMIPVIVLIGAVVWAFGGFTGEDGGAHWVFFGLAGAAFVFVCYRAMQTKSTANVSMLADMMATFWAGIFPIILVVLFVVLGIASWLAIPFLQALQLLILLAVVGGVAFFLFANG